MLHRDNTEATLATVSLLHQASVINGGRQKAPVVPAERFLRLLGIGAEEVGSGRVSVNGEGLASLLREVARHQPFDADFYAEAYPDIEAARLAGQLSDLHEHFIETGFLEGRLPSEPPFDAVWYAQYYPDVSSVIPAHDAAALRNHFLSSGLREGRAGTAAVLASGPAWLSD